MLGAHEGYLTGGGGGGDIKAIFQITFYMCEFNTFYFFNVC